MYILSVVIVWSVSCRELCLSLVAEIGLRLAFLFPDLGFKLCALSRSWLQVPVYIQVPVPAERGERWILSFSHLPW